MARRARQLPSTSPLQAVDRPRWFPQAQFGNIWIQASISERAGSVPHSLTQPGPPGLPNSATVMATRLPSWALGVIQITSTSPPIFVTRLAFQVRALILL